MQEYARQYQAMSDEELLDLYQGHQQLKVGAFTGLMLEISRRNLNGRLFSQAEAVRMKQRAAAQECPSELPRPHHYLFAHRLLRDKVFNNPPHFFDMLRGEGSIESYLSVHWAMLWISIREDRRGPFVELDGFHVSPPEQVGDLQMVTVTFPQPAYMTEAYYGVIVFNQDCSLRRYFTLEFTEDDDGMPILPVACEWEEELHRNSGIHLLPDPEEFKAWVRYMFRGRN